jgi:dTDP-4-dehydrorhamnose 3,5-epimerase-like enzyme
MNLVEKIEIINRNILNDENGWFLKVINGTERNMPGYTGEFYVVSAKCGCIRGGHYHEKATEWFTLIEGHAILTLTDIDTKDSLEIELSSKSPKTIVVPPRIAHSFLNTSKRKFILLAYTNQHYKPEDTIPFV